MNKYKVKISHVFSEILDVEAENEEAAREKVKKDLIKEDRSISPKYETTLPPEHWPIITEEKYNEMLENLQQELDNQKEENKEESNIIVP
jgi:hypothetical protein